MHTHLPVRLYHDQDSAIALRLCCLYKFPKCGFDCNISASGDTQRLSSPLTRSHGAVVVWWVRNSAHDRSVASLNLRADASGWSDFGQGTFRHDRPQVHLLSYLRKEIIFPSALKDFSLIHDVLELSSHDMNIMEWFGFVVIRQSSWLQTNFSDWADLLL